MRNRIFAALAAALLVAPTAAAAQQGEQDQQRQQQASKQEKQASKQQKIEPGQVLGTLHRINQNEIAAAQMALEKSQNEQVKQAARTVIQDHQQLDRQLTQLAEQKNIDLQAQSSLASMALERMQQEQESSLQKLSGNEFDTAWTSAQPTMHRFGIAAVEAAQEVVDDQEMKQFLQQTRSAMQKHLQVAERMLQRDVRVAGEEPQQQGG